MAAEHLRAPKALSLLALLVACHRSSSSDALPPQALVTNLELAGVATAGEDGLWLVVVRESEQGGLDLNGDGDTLDDVVHVVDLGSGALTNTGLATQRIPFARPSDVAPPLLVTDGSVAAFPVSEADQGGLDLNGDGDVLDPVLHVFERSTGLAHNLGFVAAAVHVESELVAFSVLESSQGETDLDGDGSTSGIVLHVHDLRDGSTVNLQLHSSIPLGIRGDFVGLVTSETPGLDLNGDGDDQDPFIFELYDARARAIHDTRLATIGSAYPAAGVWGVAVSESGQGRGDLNGDGDEDDAVFHTYDPATGLAHNLGLSVTSFAPSEGIPESFQLSVRESAAGPDLNGDGDLLDHVVHLYEPALDRLLDTGLASHAPAVLSRDWLGVSVSEGMQGMTDLDRDGDVDGSVVHAVHLDTGFVRNVGLDSTVAFDAAGNLLMVPYEESSGSDWNGDGDLEDLVLFTWNVSRQRLRNTRLTVANVLGAAGEVALVTVFERWQDADANGDGDLEDFVLALYDAFTGELANLGLATFGGARFTPFGAALVPVDEEYQGADLNHDGDRLDNVLHVVELL